MPTQEDDAEELSLQQQVRVLHHHLASSDAEVAALKQRESSSVPPNQQGNLYQCGEEKEDHAQRMTMTYPVKKKTQRMTMTYPACAK